MFSKIIVALAFTLFVLSYAKASSEGIDPKALENYSITGYSRPCCGFGLDILGQFMGLSGALDKERLGEHHFARLNKTKDEVGIVYTCKAGFVDISHLRDNADWSAHAYFNLPNWLGSGKKIQARLEGGFKSRSVFFPELNQEDLDSLTDDDREQIAVSLGFSMALMHEIPTSFNIAVSSPKSVFAFEKTSAFSLEDAFSNLLGNHLGAKAARSSLPYNQAMTEALKSQLVDLEAQSKTNTLSAYALVRNIWWRKVFSSTFNDTLRRDFTYQGVVTPRRIENAQFCANVDVKQLSIPNLLSNGKSVHDYYEIRGELTPRLRRYFKRMGVTISEDLTQKDYPAIIEAIKVRFVKKLGHRILE